MAAGRGDLAQIEADWPFYLAFNCFRLAAIFQGIAQRVSQGVASHPQAMETARMAGPTAALGWQLAQAL
jgi:aminoglycoside phosphotransferase (APT) family kinase protein